MKKCINCRRFLRCEGAREEVEECEEFRAKEREEMKLVYMDKERKIYRFEEIK